MYTWNGLEPFRSSFQFKESSVFYTLPLLGNQVIAFILIYVWRKEICMHIFIWCLLTTYEAFRVFESPNLDIKPKTNYQITCTCSICI